MCPWNPLNMPTFLLGHDEAWWQNVKQQTWRWWVPGPRNEWGWELKAQQYRILTVRSAMFQRFLHVSSQNKTTFVINWDLHRINARPICQATKGGSSRWVDVHRLPCIGGCNKSCCHLDCAQRSCVCISLAATLGRQRLILSQILPTWHQSGTKIPWRHGISALRFEPFGNVSCRWLRPGPPPAQVTPAEKHWFIGK